MGAGGRGLAELDLGRRRARPSGEPGDSPGEGEQRPAVAPRGRFATICHKLYIVKSVPTDPVPLAGPGAGGGVRPRTDPPPSTTKPFREIQAASVGTEMRQQFPASRSCHRHVRREMWAGTAQPVACVGTRTGPQRGERPAVSSSPTPVRPAHCPGPAGASRAAPREGAVTIRGSVISPSTPERQGRVPAGAEGLASLGEGR